MHSPHRIQPNSTNNYQKRLQILVPTTSYIATLTYKDLKRPQMTSNDLKRPQSTSCENVKSPKNKKNIVKAGSVHDNVEINKHYLDEILHSNNPLNGIKYAIYF